ncbi:hypothetical protein Nepgr_007181 [Nepenthes gracilis]|uniref:peroxidase n=1 Tax=Nepenthes gracilis TaxID=150966 RepID=A0AAD3XIA1_NEPGR|nr:hypothetical protein Nepgr_007181 [Nepenthes gracilis]
MRDAARLIFHHTAVDFVISSGQWKIERERETTSPSKSLSLLFLQPLLLSFTLVVSANAKGLRVGFYADSCPSAEATVKAIINDIIDATPSLAAPLLRLHFHDCFVRGCDASILLNSPTRTAQKDAFPNRSLRGFDVIENVKTILEGTCPGIVSCADIIALAARDAVAAVRGPSWFVETGRRDGRVSNINDALTNLPPRFSNITSPKARFKRKGLSVKDLVVLSAEIFGSWKWGKKTAKKRDGSSLSSPLRLRLKGG